MRKVFVSLGLVLLFALPVLANSGPPRLYGERSGVLVATVSDAVAVRSETLHFELAEDLASAAVTATYYMELTGSTAAEIEMAFVMVGHAPAAPVLTVDGQPLAYSVLTEVEQYAAIIEAWLAEHPAVAAELEVFKHAPSFSSDDAGPLMAALVAAGFPETAAPGVMPAEQVAIALVEHLWQPEAVNLAFAAAYALDPSLTHAVVDGWSAQFAEGRDQLLNSLTGELTPAHFYSSPGELNWLLFRVPMAPGRVHEVTVEYTQLAATDRASEAAVIYQYDYLLSPAASWASFGPLAISVRAPGEVALASTVPLAYAEGVWSASLPGLPEGELTFSVLDKTGLLPGVPSSLAYWNILAGLVALLGAPVAWLLGRTFGRVRIAWLSYVLNVIGTSLVGLLTSAALLALVLKFWRLELFTGSKAWFGWLWVLPIATLSNLVVSFVALRRGRRHE